LFSVESSFIGDADSVDDGLGGGSIRFFFVAIAGRLEEAVAYSQFPTKVYVSKLADNPEPGFYLLRQLKRVPLTLLYAASW
jgi:hypothetical protein